MKKKLNNGGLTRKGYKVKRKLEEIKKTCIILAIGFILGLLYAYLFIYQDLISEPQANEKVSIIEIPKEEEKVTQKQKKVEITEEYVCTLDEVSCKIKKVADNYGLDWKLAIAISKHETAEYTSYAFTELNNVGGMMYWAGTSSRLKQFNTIDEGIEAYVSNLKNNYIDIGLTSIEEIQKKYAPLNAYNDPYNLNSGWVSGVYKYYNFLEK